ncbi:dnaJ subfamily C member 11 [Planoprotostelium fungivorum]|uniref:DnaJ subfamily C member 11 n=1 Tax=Planoprotostelium fungivorum TaxID=1890364 RepID=A0A2P6NFB5_9EUKA|nr:dnaJ subfamily C member 11 [Planoprotostelium fungivorum]
MENPIDSVDEWKEKDRDEEKREEVLIPTSTVESPEFYGLLNVSRTATTEEIRGSFRRLAVTYHPDRVNANVANLTPELQSQAERKFEQIRTAYDTLIDPQKRAMYDRYGPESLHFTMQVALRNTSPEEKWKQREEKEKEATIHLRHTDATISLVNKKWEGYRFYVPTIETISMNQSTKPYPLSDLYSLTFRGHFKQTSRASEGRLSTELKRDLGHSSHLTAKLGIKPSGPDLSVELSKKLTSNTDVLGGVVLNENGKGRIYTKIDRNLGNNTHAGFTTHTDETGTKGSVYVTHKYGPATMRVSMGYRAPSWSHVSSMGDRMATWWLNRNRSPPPEPREETTLALESPSLRSFTEMVSNMVDRRMTSVIQVEKRLSKKMRATAEVTLTSDGAHTNASFTFGGWRNMTKNNQIGFLTSYGTSGNMKYQLGLSWGSFQLTVPFLLLTDPTASQLAFSLLCPALSLALYKLLWVEPKRRARKQTKLYAQRARNAPKIAEARADAEAAVKLMVNRVAFKRSHEENRRGLIIVTALYGLLEDIQAQELVDGDTNRAFAIVDVTIAVQCLVEESQLHLYEGSKSFLPGFYDPCPGEEKWLMVRYLFRDKIHHIVISDLSPLSAPLMCESFIICFII